ncbi:MAG TPA: GNAT family N-acetyltransferase [Solirubrobacterales bacterium]|nr:GNAT family N-acetyltransferase [Solirubrobacterales bacterium]
MSPGPVPGAVTIGTIGRGETAATVRVLNAAFLDDPITRAVGPRRRRHRAAINPLSFTGILLASRRHGGRVLVARRGGAVIGVSITFDPGAWPLHEGAVTYELAWALAAGPLPVRRGLAFARLVRDAHVSHPHHYLWFLAVDPAEQGRGAGRALLGDLHRRADADGLPTYLETGTMDNVAWYAACGYRTLSELRLAGGEPLWRMERPAAATE